MNPTLLAWITGYLLTGLATYCIVVVAFIHGGERMPELKPWYADLLVTLAFIALVPIPLAMLLRETAKILWDAGLDLIRMFESHCGTEEILQGVLWLYIAWVSIEEGIWSFAIINAVITLFLWQSARAMQKLKDRPSDKALKAQGAYDAYLRLAAHMATKGDGSYIDEDIARQLAQLHLQSAYPEPPPHVMDKHAMLRTQLAFEEADRLRDRRRIDFMLQRAALRRRADRAIEFYATAQ